MRVTFHKHLAIATIILAFAFTCYGASVSEPNAATQIKKTDEFSDSTRAQIERLAKEYYKDTSGRQERALYTIIAIVAGFVIYVVFKDRGEYNKAVAEAREASKEAREAGDKARDWEEKAREKLVRIDEEVEAKLKEIDVRGQAQVQKLLKEAEKQRKVSREQAEKERKISELFSKGVTAGGAKDYETAADCYRQIVEELKEENDPITYYNWGTALIELAKSKKGTEAEKLLNQAIGKYQKALEKNLDFCDAYVGWGAALLYLAKLKGGKDAEDLLKQAEEKCLKAESIKTSEGAYNLACVYALRDNEDKCKEWLKVGEKAGTLEHRRYAIADDDFKSVRDKDWFKKLRWKGE